MSKVKEPREFVVEVTYTLLQVALVPVIAHNLYEARKAVTADARSMKKHFIENNLMAEEFSGGITVVEAGSILSHRILKEKITRLDCTKSGLGA